MLAVEQISADLFQRNYSIAPAFLSLEEVSLFYEEANTLLKEGKFMPAATGQGSQKSRHLDIRKDSTLWLDPFFLSPLQKLLWDKLETLRSSLNQKLFLGAFHFEGHYAHYPAGAFYKKHLDCFQGDDRRVLSTVLYLNRDWRNADGGALRLYAERETIEVAPTAGTLVCFFSDCMEHEVLLTRRDRFSFAGWFKKSGGQSSV